MVMRANRVFFSVSLFFATGLYACQPDINTDQAICTTEFRSVGLRVIGDTLTDFYTIRLSNSDTIRRSTGVEPQTHWYLVLDDSYQRQLVNKQESFRFIGKKGQTIVIREEYIIAADQCHINKVSGKSEIQL